MTRAGEALDVLGGGTCLQADPDSQGDLIHCSVRKAVLCPPSLSGLLGSRAAAARLHFSSVLELPAEEVRRLLLPPCSTSM